MIGADMKNILYPAVILTPYLIRGKNLSVSISVGKIFGGGGRN